MAYKRLIDESHGDSYNFSIPKLSKLYLHNIDLLNIINETILFRFQLLLTTQFYITVVVQNK